MFNLFLLVSFAICFGLTQLKLVRVIQINRHGARTSSNYGKEPLNEIYGEDQKLTQNGYRQHQLLGKYARKKYIQETSFLSDEYNPDEFEIFSTPKQRTIYSSDGFISGIYPGNVVKTTFNEPTFNLKSDDTIPIKDVPPIKEIPLTVISKKELELFDIMDCSLNGTVLDDLSKDQTIYPDVYPISDEEMDIAATAFAEYYNKKQDLIDSSPKKFMTQINKYNIPYFYHYGKTYEDEVGNVATQVNQKIAINKWYNTRLKENVLSNIEISRFFLKILSMFNEAINATSTENLKANSFKKYTVYSGHDSAIVNAMTNIIDLSFLNLIVKGAISNNEAFNFIIPLYSSNIIYELHLNEATKEYYVMMYYNGNLFSYLLREGAGLNKEGKIPYKSFEKLINSRIHPDWDKVDCSMAKHYHNEIFPFPSLNDYIYKNGNYYYQNK